MRTGHRYIPTVFDTDYAFKMARWYKWHWRNGSYHFRREYRKYKKWWYRWLNMKAKLLKNGIEYKHTTDRFL